MKTTISERESNRGTLTYGVIVARMQCDMPTIAHQMLVNEVMKRCHRVLIILGSAPVRNTRKNPLPVEMRKHPLTILYPHVQVTHLSDFKCDKIWSGHLDQEVIKFYGSNSVKIYGARDNCFSRYHGSFETCELKLDIPADVSATKQRQRIAESNYAAFSTEEFRRGMIYAAFHRYPVSFQTVDVAIVHSFTKAVLVGRKPNESDYRFIGGFVDPADFSLEKAAHREVLEEAGDKVENKDYRYLGSFRIDDWRYRSEHDKIMSAFFVCEYICGRPEASDDIEKTQWLSFEMLKTTAFEPEHEPLRQKLIEHLQL